MTNLLLTNDNLINLINSLKISDEQKSSLALRIPQLNEEERVKLLETLKDVYIMDIEKVEAIEKIKENWQ